MRPPRTPFRPATRPAARRPAARRALGAAVLALSLGSTLGAAPALADDPVRVPEVAEIEAAQREADVASMGLGAVRAELAAAQARSVEAGRVAARAAEAFNGARWRAEKAARHADISERRAAHAAAEAGRQRAGYAEIVLTGYQQGPSLTALSSVTRADGIESVVERTTAMRMAETALDGHARAAAQAWLVASATRTDAVTQRRRADAAETEAREASDAAAAAAAAAAAEAQRSAREQDALVARVAELQDVSVALAAQREEGLALRAQRAQRA